MTTDRKIRANRANARANSGPKSPGGRNRSARNALRHALSLPVGSNPLLSQEAQTLACEVAGPGADAEILSLARLVAEAQIDLRRVRQARHRVLSDALANPHYDSRANLRAKMSVLRSLLQKDAAEVSMSTLQFLNSVPEGPDKLATILLQEKSERSRGATLLFEPWMRRDGDARNIARIN